MAYGDVAALLPAETLYREPGAYREAARAEAAKRADYLAQMDMYMEEVTRAKEEFQKTYALQKEAFEFEKEKHEDYMGLERMKAASTFALGMADVGVRREAVKATSPQYQWGTYEQAHSELERKMYGADTGVEKEWFKEQVQYASGAKTPTSATTAPRAGSFTGAGTSVYGPSGQLMIAGGSAASYDEELRKRYATGVF